VGRAVAQPAVLVAHHRAHEPAARRRAATKNAGIIILAGKRDFALTGGTIFIGGKYKIVISLLNRQMFSVVGDGSTLCVPANTGKASVCLKKWKRDSERERIWSKKLWLC
jgi:hypothetical protein